MLERLQAVAAENHGVITTAQARVAGVVGAGLTALLRSGAVARLRRGVYCVGTAPTLSPRTVAVGLSAVLSHLSAAAWWGVDLPRPLSVVHVTASRNRGRRRDAVTGVRLHRADLPACDIRNVRGVAVTSPLRTSLDLARHLSLEDAVAIVDAFFRARLLNPAEFRAAASAARGPGRLRIQTVSTLVDPHSGSVLESLTRVLLWRHGLRPPVSQHPFEGSDGFRGRLDFAWPALRVALECDGYDYHSDRVAFRGDRRRWSALVRAGWTPGVVTWWDVVGDPGYVVGLVRDLLALAQSSDQHTIVTREAFSA